jgi:bifunctional DNA-binding transcriptional regulator/antitoxin component of YhaV-PrlF toxin-antitoxin module
VVLPGPIRRRLGIRAGDPLEANIEAGRMVLTPRQRCRRQARIISDPVTGLPVLSAGAGDPPLSSKDVDEILASFP